MVDRRANAKRAIAHCEEARRGALAANDSLFIGQIEHNLSSEKFISSRLEGTTEVETSRLREEAEQHARSSLERRPLEVTPVEAGRTWAHLGDILREDGRHQEAVAAYENALRGLTPTSAPRACRNAARSLADLATELGELELAANAWETAAESALHALTARSVMDGRFDELRETITLFRFAAFAVGLVGRHQRAIEILEQGRARELASSVQRNALNLERLHFIDAELCAEYVDAKSQIETLERARRLGSPIGFDSPVGESFQRTVEKIRLLPDFANAFGVASFEEIAAGALPGTPLAYLVCAPQGSGLFIVWRERGVPEIEYIHADLTSQQVAYQVLGIGEEEARVPSYLLAQSDSVELDETIKLMESTIADKLMKPLAESLERGGAKEVCVIPTGLLGLMPLHALQWVDGHQRRCLIDDFDVTFAPSAMMRVECVKRVKLYSRSSQRLLAVGNPLPHPNPLPGAEFEVEVVASTFGIPDTVILNREGATKKAVTNEMGAASHIHLACHGEGTFFADALSAALSLANNERLTASEILDIPIGARLVVASACESGVIQGYETIDESLGLTSALLSAGAASVVSTLWAIDDLASSLLMSRFYEGVAAGESPSHALRVAQLWLRTLTQQRADHYIASRPTLKSLRAKRAGQAEPIDGSMRPYSAYSYWAPYMVSGA